jgi:hypothetical protein
MVDIHHVHKKDAPSGTAKTIKSEISRKVPIESLRVGEVIGDHILELSNGSEIIKITHSVLNRDTFAKGCLNYVYWILTKTNGFYNRMEISMNENVHIYVNDNIAVCFIQKDLPEPVIKYYTNLIHSNNLSLTKIALVREIKKSNFDIKFFQIINNAIKQINYCGYSMLVASNFITDKYYIRNGNIYINNIQYNFKQNETTHMVSLPTLTYIDNKNKDKDNIIIDIINQTTDLILFGIGRYQFENNYYLVLEIKDNIFELDILGTISTIINNKQPNNLKYNVIFINTNYWLPKDKCSLYMRYFEAETNEETTDNCLVRKLLAVTFFISFFF